MLIELGRMLGLRQSLFLYDSHTGQNSNKCEHERDGMLPSGWGIELKIRRSGVRFQVLVMCKSVGQTSFSTLPQSTQP